MSDYGERLKALRKARYPDFSEDMDMHDITDGISWMADRIEGLEAKLAEAVEEAEKYQHAFAAQSRKLQAVLHIDGVRTTIAELTGGNDE